MMKKKFQIFLLLISVLAYSQDSIKVTNLEAITLIKQNSDKNYQEFRKIFYSQKYNFKKWSGLVSGSYNNNNEEQNIDGTFKLTAFLNVKDYILSSTNEIASKQKEKIIKNIVHIAFNNMRIFGKDKIDGFYCEKIDDKHWKFLAAKGSSKEFLKISAEDYLELVVELGNTGKLLAIKSNLSTEKYQYHLNIDFSQYRNFLAFKKIKFVGNKGIEKFNIDISFL